MPLAVDTVRSTIGGWPLCRELPVKQLAVALPANHRRRADTAIREAPDPDRSGAGTGMPAPHSRRHPWPLAGAPQRPPTASLLLGQDLADDPV